MYSNLHALTVPSPSPSLRQQALVFQLGLRRDDTAEILVPLPRGPVNEMTGNNLRNRTPKEKPGNRSLPRRCQLYVRRFCCRSGLKRRSIRHRVPDCQ